MWLELLVKRCRLGQGNDEKMDLGGETSWADIREVQQDLGFCAALPHLLFLLSCFVVNCFYLSQLNLLDSVTRFRLCQV